MLELKDDNGKLLPNKVQKRVNDFIEHLKEIPWFKPRKDLDKSEVEKQVKFTLKCFGIEAEIEYRKLSTPKDWASARASALDSAWDSARVSARVSARDSARASAWDSAWDAVGDSAWDSAWDAVGDSARVSAWDYAEILLEDNKQFKEKYPDGAFIQLLKIWEMGLYPVGVLAENKKFVIYIPAVSQEFPDLF